jgi:tetratricopeptide (TPR) repeat protein
MNNLENQNNSQELTNQKPKRIWFILIGILMIIIAGGAGWFFGSQEGQNLRDLEQKKTVLEIAQTQYDLGVRELEEGRYENARKRFEYVIQHAPDFPGAQEKLTEVLIAQSIVNTPTPSPSPTVEPTPDFRGEQELFEQAWQYILAEDWDNTILTLDILRDKNLQYQPVEVDGMYYIALRNRGVIRILQDGSLEPGMYDLALSERFAPLDNDADGYRVWARYYLSGASFWGIDWAQVVAIFGQLYPSFPNLHDSSGITAQERYRVGLLKWGDELALQEEFCLAQEKYDLSFALLVDESVGPAATAIYDACERSKEPEETPTPAITLTPTPTITTEGTLIVPTTEPTGEVIPTETIEPTADSGSGDITETPGQGNSP